MAECSDFDHPITLETIAWLERITAEIWAASAPHRDDLLPRVSARRGHIRYR